MFIKFSMQVGDTYVYGFLKNESLRSKLRCRKLRIYVTFLKGKTIKTELSNTDCLILYNRCVYISQCIHHKLYLYTNSHIQHFLENFVQLCKHVFLLIKIPTEGAFRYVGISSHCDHNCRSLISRKYNCLLLTFWLGYFRLRPVMITEKMLVILLTFND